MARIRTAALTFTLACVTAAGVVFLVDQAEARAAVRRSLQADPTVSSAAPRVTVPVSAVSAAMGSAAGSAVPPSAGEAATGSATPTSGSAGATPPAAGRTASSPTSTTPRPAPTTTKPAPAATAVPGTTPTGPVPVPSDAAATGTRPAAAGSARTQAQPAVTPSARITLPAVPQPDTDPSATAESTAAESTAADSTSAESTAAEPTSGKSADQIAEAVGAAVQQAADDGVTEHVEVMDRRTGAVLATADADAQAPAMSVMKLFIASDVLVRNGGIGNLDDAEQTRLTRMITGSDDEVAQDYWDSDGGSAIIQRTIDRYGLAESAPPSVEHYWGDTQITAADEASFLRQVLSDPVVGPWLERTMTAAADTAVDGFDQDFGVNTVAGAGSKQGWGCCLSDVMAINSVGFTADLIVVVLSDSDPDASAHVLGTAAEITDDPGAQTAVQAVTDTARAALV